MKVNGQPCHSIWVDEGGSVLIIDQTCLPWTLREKELKSLDDAACAIRAMEVRGAPLIGVTAAFGVAIAMRVDSSDSYLATALSVLKATRPTAVNLLWALDRMNAALSEVEPADRVNAAWKLAIAMADEDVSLNSAIGDVGSELLTEMSAKKGETLNLLTHCNAGWLATVDWGTALSPIYKAHDAGLSLHVWVDETRPRNQGALTAWELRNHGVPHTYIVDNAGGLLMQRGEVDAVIVGCDRVAANGDVCNKIGTYLKALAAKANGIPFYVALPSPTFDPMIACGADIPIEERAATEVSHVNGPSSSVAVVAEATAIANLGFDITPAELVTGYITDKGLLDRGQLISLLA